MASNLLLEKKMQKDNSYSHWSVTMTSETVNLDQSGRRKINSSLKIYATVI